MNDGAMTGMQGLATPADLHLTCRPQARLSVILALREGGMCFSEASWRLLGLLTRIHAPGFLAEACTSSQRCTSCGCCGVCSCDRSMSHNSGQAGAGAQAMLSESVHTGLACSFRSACSCIISMLSLKADRCRRRKEDMWWPYAPCSGDPLGAPAPPPLAFPAFSTSSAQASNAQ